MSIEALARFAGPVVAAADFGSVDLPADGVVGCIGTDAPMLDVVASLVGEGRSVRIFEDRPHPILPRPHPILPRPLPVPPRRAELLATTGAAIGLFIDFAPRPLLPGPVRDRLAASRRLVEDRAAAAHLQRAVADRWTRRQLTPSRWDRRSALRHDGYLAAVGAANCTLVSWPIASVTPRGVRTCDGIEHRLGLIVTAARSSDVRSSQLR